jgi:hypothetical protein
VSLTVGGEPGRPGAVHAARAALAAAVDLSPGDLVFAAQVHGPRVARVGRTDRGRGVEDHATAVPGVDALVTTDPGVGLAVLAADCVPLLLVAPGRAVAAVHAGRAGLEAGVVPAALAALRAAAGDPAGVVAVAGPAIGPCCYEVEQALADRVAAAVGPIADRTRWGTPSLDLVAGVEAQLRADGVTRIERVGECTRCGGGPWFSARASGSTLSDDAPAGRHAAVIRRLALAASPGPRDRRVPFP